MPIRATCEKPHPILDTLYGQNDDLRSRVQNFWSDGMNCFVEAEVLAHHAEALEATDFSILRPRLEAGSEDCSAGSHLGVGDSGRPLENLNRLVQLQRSDELRRKYFDLLEALWLPIATWWETVGISTVESSVSDVRRSLERGAKWHQIVANECETLVQHLPEIIDRNENGHRLVLAGCALFGKGLYLELPGCTLVGFGAHGPRCRRLEVGPNMLCDPFGHLPIRLGLPSSSTSQPVGLR